MISSVLVVGGIDSSGRAGIAADCAAIARWGGRAVPIPTVLTAQGGLRFFRKTVERSAFRRMLDACGEVGAVKIGAIGNEELARCLEQWIERRRVPVVIDPVVVTSRGECLSELRPATYRRLAATGATLTPNAAELTWIDRTPVQLLALGYSAIVVKGGGSAHDVVHADGEVQHLRGRALRRAVHHRGTGCRFAAIMALELARGRGLFDAARRAKRYVRSYLQGRLP